MLVKICGITTLEDARAAVDLGADALGFNFHPQSPRYIEPEDCEEILARLPEGVLKVAVTVSGGPRPRIPQAIQAVQVHKATAESDLEEWGREVWAALKPGELDRFPGRDIVVDPSLGRGLAADWRQVRREARGRPFILAGGLDPANVAEAIRQARPKGVDVCSGVESAPGRKDLEKLKQFMRAAKSAAPENTAPQRRKL